MEKGESRENLMCTAVGKLLETSTADLERTSVAPLHRSLVTLVTYIAFCRRYCDRRVVVCRAWFDHWRYCCMDSTLEGGIWHLGVYLGRGVGFFPVKYFL
jgi:hypothetical protein